METIFNNAAVVVSVLAMALSIVQLVRKYLSERLELHVIERMRVSIATVRDQSVRAGATLAEARAEELRARAALVAAQVDEIRLEVELAGQRQEDTEQAIANIRRAIEVLQARGGDITFDITGVEGRQDTSALTSASKEMQKGGRE
jgi:hypothetical protein